ncbi:hypothetical protein DICVIV_08921 [Dictyocaulus viviparus]|uniref:G-protein coupled receptors family 1 profile domain-containing protein n=1 Tax=Dictyocaulus viviparus TaxID=29172 RepID=A0A0D8XKA0_DICVI|nr:hypothetical protein DICVIV_08921 [Dictyocaulus viviparus]
MTMIFERCVAIFHALRYEKFSKTLGNCLLLLTIVITVCQCCWSYINEDFNSPQITCLFTPPKRRNERNIQLYVLLSVHFVGLLTMMFVYTVHHRNQRQLFRLNQSLSVRFQICENLTSSRLLFTLSALQLIIYFVYPLSVLFLKKNFNPTKNSLAVFLSNIHVAYLVSEYTLILPLVTIKFLRNIKQVRRSNIQSMIQMKAAGEEGWAVYSRQLRKQWE